MSNEPAASNYPPLPSIRGFDGLDTRYVENLLATYGHAVAAPLLARIALLEVLNSDFERLIDKHAETLTERDLLRAEVEEYKADAQRLNSRAIRFGDIVFADVDLRKCIDAAARKGEGSEG
jgi:hypothetical protein